MKELKTYKIIVPYTESAQPTKKFSIEYTIEAENRCDANRKADAEFNTYAQNTSASWIRTADPTGIRIWRIFSEDPQTPGFIDELIAKLPCETQEETLAILDRLGQLEDSAASSKIISLTKNDNPTIVATAIVTLGKIGDPTNFFAVKNSYSQKPSPEVKKAAVEVLIKLALPEDDILGFYRIAIHDEATRKIVFNLPSSDLIPLWLAEIETKEEFEMVKANALKLGEKALMALTTLNVTHPQVFAYAKELALLLKPYALEYVWADWPAVANKYTV